MLKPDFPKKGMGEGEEKKKEEMGRKKKKKMKVNKRTIKKKEREGGRWGEVKILGGPLDTKCDTINGQITKAVPNF